MIPVLFEKTETKFETQGIGCLSDVISCTVTEERNGSFELKMIYPLDGLHYPDIRYGRIILAVPADGAQAEPFDIYKISRPIGGKVSVYARHISYRLSYTATLQCGNQASAEAALNALKANAVSSCPFTFESDNFKAGTFHNDKTQSIRSLLGGQTGSVLDTFGGEYQWNRWTVRLRDARGASLPVTLEYGKNITDLTQEENIESTYTAVICTWSKEKEDGTRKEVHGKLVYTSNHELFPYDRTLVVDKTTEYDDEPSADRLTQDAAKYITDNNVGVPKVSIKVSFVNLRDTEEYKNVAPLQTIHLCDTIKVRFEKLGVNAAAKVIKTEYNVLNERYNSIEVGEARTSLASTIAGTSAEIEKAEKDITAAYKSELAKATAMITGGLGGYVIIRRNEDTGYPDEILIMDQPDKQTAKNVIRMNKNGIGFSQNGYNGPFNSAWTIDGVFDANYIGAGTINADLIKAGVLADGANKFYLDMSSGKLVMQDGKFSGELDCGKTSHGNNSGSGLYANSRGISIGNVASWGGVPIFSVNLDNGEDTPVRTTGLGFYHSDGSTFGYFYPWGTQNGDGGLAASHRLSGRERGVQFNWDMRVDGNLYAGEVSSANHLYAMNGVYANGDCELGRSNGNTTLIGYEPGEGGSVLRVNSSGVSIKVGLNMNGYGIADCPSLSDRSLKTDIKDLMLEKARKLISSLRPRTFSFKNKPGHIRHGFIAQEVDENDEGKSLVSHPKGAPLSIYYEDIIADLVCVVQDQERRIKRTEKMLQMISKNI